MSRIIIIWTTNQIGNPNNQNVYRKYVKYNDKPGVNSSYENDVISSQSIENILFRTYPILMISLKGYIYILIIEKQL